ncbi:MAG TPA: arabinofuranosidase catalytic domain-containing protein [Mycobacteriales bacterium]|nr:arabinofuranosidase catalytic domain-containing protein [Mycobacteriales bacterium]
MVDSLRRGSGRLLHASGIITALLLAVMFCVPLQSGTAHAAIDGPCDIYAAAGTPCVAAYSPARALFSSYGGPLYQVQRASDGATTDVGLLAPGGYADARTQDLFCAHTTCTVTLIYDQTPRHNDLSIAGPGTAGGQDKGAVATALPITVAGHKAYGLYLPEQTGYRRSSVDTTGTARNGAPESMYEVASGTNANDDCCSDFGNVETRPEDTGQGHMDALNISYLNARGSSGSGPWVQGDLENGVFEGHTGTNPANLGNSTKFVTAVLKNNGQDTFALKGADAQQGRLSTWYEGLEPVGDYTPMKQEGSIVLGTGGDNSNRSTGSFFEGVMTAGYSTDAADDAVQANVVAQHYRAVSTGGGPGWSITSNSGRCVDVTGDDDGEIGSVVRLADCRALAADQHWIGADSIDGVLSTRGGCLAPTDATMILADCTSAAQEKWRPQADGTLTGSGRCLTAVGVSLQVAPCAGTPAQRFVASVPIQHAGKCVDVAGDDNGGDGAAVQLWDCQTIERPGAEAADQQWAYHSADHTVRTLGRCLSPGAAGLQLSECTGDAAQKWIPESGGTIKNIQAGQCMEVPGDSTTNGTRLQLAGCSADPAQIFQLN